ncbi:MAG: ABC transporter substrate-binding protein [Anaerolineae bacterium]
MIKHIRWQAAIALLGVVVLGLLLGNLAYTRTTVIVPDHGGTYIEGLAGSPTYINPLLWQNETERDLASLIFGGLTRGNDEGEIIPDLAARWDISNDGLTYTFHLREDLRWHDGAPFTADDVVFTLKTMQAPGYEVHPDLADLWRSVIVTKVNQYTVRFTLSEPFAPFLDYTTIGILPAHLLKDVPIEALAEDPFNRHPVGTGPFMVEDSNAAHILLKANPYFYGPRPYLDKIEFKFYPDYQSLFSAHQRGEIQGLSRVLTEDLARVGEDEGLILYSAQLAGCTLIFLNLDELIFQEQEVRQALLLALDRQGLIDDLLGGQGVVAHSPLLPHSWAYDPAIKRYAYDPQGARALLDGAGWVDADEDGIREKGRLKLEFTLLTNADPIRARMIEAISRQWERVGVKAHTQTVGVAELQAEFLRPRQFQAVLFGWNSLSFDPDPYPLWHSTQAQDEGQNYAGFANSEADTILEEARRTTDQALRAEMYRRFQEIFAEEVPSLLLYHPIYHYAVDERVRDVQLGRVIIAPSDRFRNIARWYIKTKRVILTEASQGG